MMPVMNGIETFKKMRQENILDKRTKVVMLTASAIAGMREIYLNEGFDDYLSKPIDVGELEKMLAKYLPEEMVTYEDEDAPKTVESKESATVAVATEESAAVEEKVDADSFSSAEKQKFAESCPDINLEVGMKYCMDSKSFTIQMLSAFTDAKKADKIQAKFDASDWKGYQILIHALKSTALSIGAESLSEAAKKLELAAKNGDVEEIQAKHADLMTDYKKVREEIEQWLKGAVE